MSFGRIALTALLATALAVSACGRKGDPVRPGSDQDPKKPAASATTN
jgi:predicted small lipoprotein YifL